MKTNSDRMLTTCAIVVSACVLAVSGYLYVANVGHRWADLVPVLVICAAWVAHRLTNWRHDVTQAIALSGLLLLIALVTKMAEHFGWGGQLATNVDDRSSGIIMGAIVVAVANVVPKRACSAGGQTMLRIAGWALVLGGLGYSLAWLVLPIAAASTIALLVLSTGLAIAAASYVNWYRLSRT
jgi:hypothetical protein